MLKKIILASLLTTGFYAQAENNISYNYLEVDYQYIDFDEGNANGLTFNGAFTLNDSFYLGGYFERNNVGDLDLNQYGVLLGFHHDISETTDFYSELNVGKADVGFISPLSTGSFKDDSNTYGLDIGTRTAFTETFELISKLGYVHNDKLNDGFYKIGLKGLFKFNDNSSFTAGIENADSDAFIASVGYRYSF